MFLSHFTPHHLQSVNIRLLAPKFIKILKMGEVRQTFIKSLILIEVLIVPQFKQLSPS
jgi:hypothetical protein